MSFKIFSLQILGKIKPTDQIEAARKQLEQDYAAFKKVEQLAELKRFLEVEKEVTSDAFLRRKKETEQLKYSGSYEHKLEKEYERLKKSKALVNYFRLLNSDELKRYQKEKESSRMQEYYQLHDYVKNGSYKTEIQNIKRQVYRGSQEEKHAIELKNLEKSTDIKAFLELDNSERLKQHLDFGNGDVLKRFNELKNSSDTDKEKQKELKKLQGDSKIKEYFRFEHSKKYKLYLETKDSHRLKRYWELKELTESDEFKQRVEYLKDRKKAEKSDAFKKYCRYKELSSDELVQFILKFEKSKSYKNFLDTKDSFALKRLLELEDTISSDAFKQKKAWLKDPKRWEKTEDFTTWQEFEKLKQHPGIDLYLRYRGTDAFANLAKQQVVFEDDFKGKTQKEVWQTTYQPIPNAPVECLALPGDYSVFTPGKNLKLTGQLGIEVRKENVQGMIWQMPAGFVPAEFDYTSGILTTSASFLSENAIIEAKVRFNPHKAIYNAIYISGQSAMPRLNLVELGARNKVGVSQLNSANKVQSTGLDISNLKPGIYVFTLEKSGRTCTWKINEIPVFTHQMPNLEGQLTLGISSMVVDEIPNRDLPYVFEVHWIRCCSLQD